MALPDSVRLNNWVLLNKGWLDRMTTYVFLACHILVLITYSDPTWTRHFKAIVDAHFHHFHGRIWGNLLRIARRIATILHNFLLHPQFKMQPKLGQRRAYAQLRHPMSGQPPTFRRSKQNGVDCRN